MLQISNSYLSLSFDSFTESITVLSFSCNAFHLCCLWYPAEDGSDVSVPRTIAFLLFLLLQQLFILCLRALPLRSRKCSVASSTTLRMLVPTWNPHPRSPLLWFAVPFSRASRSALSDCRTWSAGAIFLQMQRSFIVSVLNELALISHPSQTCCVCFYNKQTKTFWILSWFFSVSLATPPLFILANLSHPLISFPSVPEPSWAAFQLIVSIISVRVSLPFVYISFLTLSAWQKLSTTVYLK